MQSPGDRKNLTNIERNNQPIEVEKGNIVTYTVEFRNNASGAVGNHDSTQLYNMIFTDTPKDGITITDVKANRGSPSGTGVTITRSPGESGALIINAGSCVLGSKTNNNPIRSESLYLTITARIDKSNFTLENLANSIDISSIKNRNGVEIKNLLKGYYSTKNTDYVRLKNLKIAGTVWNDADMDGIKDTGEKGIGNIEVRLIDLTNNKYIKTNTAADGTYNFGTANAKGYKIQNVSNSDGMITYTETNTQDSKLMCDGEGRVVKATNRNDSNGNYAGNNSYIKYVIEYKYDGIDYYTTTYAGRRNIQASDLSAIGNYDKDSNAKESNKARETLYDNLDTIYYNKAINTTGNTTNLTYNKNGHISSIVKDNLYLKAYSFGNGDSIEPLWLEKSDKTVTGESGYLNNINLGLIFKQADLEVTSDVDSVTTYVGGEQTKYNYGQGGVASGRYAGAYRTGGENQDVYYEGKIYSSDYYYQSSDYDNEEIRRYKENTELEMQVKYKFTIYNKSNTGNQTYARIKEFTNYYDKIFKTNLGDYTTVKLYDGSGELISTQLSNFIVSTGYNYGQSIAYQDRSGNNTDLNKVYLKTPIDIPEGGRAEFYITYIVDKESHRLSTGEIVDLLKINDELIRNIAEINTYSIYKNGTQKGFGLIDKDSNPGNIANNEAVSQYEDDTYESRIKITKRTENNEDTERTISGYVWEDVRNVEINADGGVQYAGNGLYNTSDKKNPNAMSLNTSSDNDQRIAGVTTHLIEEVRIKQSDGSYKLYEYDWAGRESKAYKELSSVKNQNLISTTNNIGEYELKSIVPGIYKVRFYYGSEDKNGNIGDLQLQHNGQDFKSTKYTGIIQDTESINKLFSSTTGKNVDLKAIASATRNDAMDDEIRRLECMAYSEIQTNKNQSVLNQNNIIKAGAADKENAKREYAEKTHMYADTGFIKLNTELTRDSNDDIEMNKKSYSFIEGSRIFNKIQYSFKVNNIDFGIEYRPRTAISLNKYITEFKVVLSDNSVLANLKYNEVYDEQNHSLIGTVLNKEQSSGTENIMMMGSINDSQRGAILLNVDDSIIRGATVTANYILVGKNEGEIDRISVNLDNIRNEFNSIINDAERNKLITETVSAVALERLQDDFKEQKNDGTTITDLGKNLADLKYKYLFNGANNKGYYGKYLGSTYYKGEVQNDVISKTKINNIIDYVPTGLDFDQDQNVGENNYWSILTITEDGKGLEEYIDNSIFETKNGGKKNIYDILGSTYYDYDSTKSNIAFSEDEDPYIERDDMLNKSLSRLLIPDSADDYSLNNNDGKTKSSGIIRINASKSLSSDTKNAELWYTNSAEIVKMTSQTGRVLPTARDRIGVGANKEKPKTRPINVPDEVANDDTLTKEPIRELTATLGNFEPKLLLQTYEVDSSAVDPLIIVPPFGIVPLYLKLNSRMVITISAAVVCIIAGIVIGKKKKVAIRKFLKRKKINISFKKYYK